jgi:hypothetical protein
MQLPARIFASVLRLTVLLKFGLATKKKSRSHLRLSAGTRPLSVQELNR